MTSDELRKLAEPLDRHYPPGAGYMRAAADTIERLQEALRESTTDLVCTEDNIRTEMKRDASAAVRWEGVPEHLRERIDANRKLLDAALNSAEERT